MGVVGEAVEQRRWSASVAEYADPAGEREVGGADGGAVLVATREDVARSRQVAR